MPATVELDQARATAIIRFAAPAKPGAIVSIGFAVRNRVAKGFGLTIADRILYLDQFQMWYPVAVKANGEWLEGAMAPAGVTKLQVPRGWRSVVTASLVRHQEQEGEVSETWRSPSGRPRSVAAGPYTLTSHDTRGRPVRVYGLTITAAQARETAAYTARAVAELERFFGTFPYPDYAIAEFPERTMGGSYAVGGAGVIFAVPQAFLPETANRVTFAHEAAHAWRGNQVMGGGRGGFLISESLAQVSALCAVAEIQGRPAATEHMRFGRLGYSDGVSARAYFSEIFGITLEDLRRAFTTAGDAAAIQRFFSQWLDRPAAPVLDVDWKPDARGGRAFVEITVRQPDPPFELAPEFLVLTGSRSIRQRIAITGRETRVRLALLARATSVQADPDHALFRWDPAYGSCPGVGSTRE